MTIQAEPDLMDRGDVWRVDSQTRVVRLGSRVAREGDRKAERLRQRIVAAVGRAHDRAVKRGGEEHYWWWAGYKPYWVARQMVGSAAPRAEVFRRGVDDLLNRGELIEVWLDHGRAGTPCHGLLIPGRWNTLSHPVVEAVGLPDVLAREPWYAAVAARGHW